MRSLGVAFVATRSPVPHWAARTWMGATPQAEGLLRARGQVCFHTPAPALHGSLPNQESLAGRHQAPPKAADHAVGPPSGTCPCRPSGGQIIRATALAPELARALMGCLDLVPLCSIAGPSHCYAKDSLTSHGGLARPTCVEGRVRGSSSRGVIPTSGGACRRCRHDGGLAHWTTTEVRPLPSSLSFVLLQLADVGFVHSTAQQRPRC